MQLAAIPDNESQRLEALYRYNILDTDAEQGFDDLAQLASYICDAPIAVITMVDKDRQWFKSKIGLDVAETPRDIGFCAHVVNQTELFVVPDASKDERFFDNPMVTDAPHVRFYAGAPLITPDGQVIGSLCTIDSKPRQLSEQQRKALIALSRQVISQMELRLNVKNLKLANQHKSTFLSNMSHEIRTPLNSILGYCQLLKMDVPEAGLGESIHRAIGNIEFSGNHLLELINSILEISRIEANKILITRSTIELEPFVKAIIDCNQLSATGVGLSLNYHLQEGLPTSFASDRTKLTQILMNLIGNAIKFTPEGGSVDVSIGQHNDELVFEIKDSGIGIANEHQASIFDAFKQVSHSRTRQYEGSGLGLSITKKLVDFLDGRIEMRSELGQGACFTVSIPVLAEALIHEAESVQNDNSYIPLDLSKRTLIVEDNPVNQAIIEAFFKKLSLNYRLAGDGAEAIEQVRRYKPDLVLMDIHLPEINGIEATETIHSMAGFEQLPVIALTADAFIEQQRDAISANFSEYLSKPLRFEQLIETLGRYIPQQ